MKPAIWPLRLPGVRHVRAMWHMYRINKHYDAWAALGFAPAHADEDYAIVERIRKGDL